VIWILAIPIEFRLAGLFLAGLCLGSLANLGAYRLAWRPRAISPWSRPDPNAPRRRWLDRVPVIGWLGLRRESPLYGPGFWVRPMLVEVAFGAGCAALYWWEVVQRGLEPSLLGLPPGVAALVPTVAQADLHARFAVHVVLFWLMLAASLIDVDEKTIPDAITVPGTLLGLLAAALYPWSMLPVLSFIPGVWPKSGFLNVTFPNDWPGWMSGFPHLGSLVLGFGCWWLWCVALMPRTWYARHGWRRALGLCVARLRRDPATRTATAVGLFGSAAITAVWAWGSPAAWVGLLSALVGMAGSGGLVWLVRIIGRATLGREAMGFGDVTLMAMMGAFLGWQTCLVIFFLAPLAGLAVGLAMLVLRQGREIPYGPFLCLAGAGAILWWAKVWEAIEPPLQVLGPLVPLFVVFCLALMAVLLGLWRLARGLFA